MNIRLFLIITAIGLVLTGASGEAGEQQSMKKLTVKELEVHSKDILNDLKAFKEREDIQALTKAIAALKALESYERPDANEWASVRKSQAELWVRAIQMIDAKSDRDFNFDDVPEMNIAAPGPYPSGISPASIKEPELREQYEQAIAANKRKANKYLFQHELKAIKSGIFKEAKEYLVALYAAFPEAVGELKDILQSYGIDKRFETEICKRLTPEIDGI